MLAVIFSVLLLLHGVLQSAADEVSLKTYFVQVTVDTIQGAIIGLSADFFGKQKFSKNAISAPILLQAIKNKDGSVMSWSKRSVSGLQSGSNSISFIVDSYLTSTDISPLVRESVSISVTENLRNVLFSVKGELLNSEASELQALAYPFASSAPSLTALTSEGVVQMMGKTADCLGLDADLERFFALGDNSTLEIIAHIHPTHPAPALAQP
ncbi:hypothetical protein EON63_06295, partial [archaeon]